MSIFEIFPIEKFTSKSGSILTSLPPQLREQLEGLLVEKKYRKGQAIFVEGSFPSGLFYISNGLVKKYKTDGEGKEHILYLCSSGELLGYSALLCDEPYPDSAMALEDSTLGFLTKDVFLRMVKSSNEFMLALLSALSHEFGVMANSITLFARMSVRERLALMLLVLTAKFRKNSISDEVEIILSREDLANLVGAATETLVRLLQEFKNDGLIEIKSKKIIVLNPKGLVQKSKFY